MSVCVWRISLGCFKIVIVFIKKNICYFNDEIIRVLNINMYIFFKLFIFLFFFYLIQIIFGLSAFGLIFIRAFFSLLFHICICFIFMYNISFFSSYFLQFIRFIFINEFQFLIQKKSNNKNISFLFVKRPKRWHRPTVRSFVCPLMAAAATTTTF